MSDHHALIGANIFDGKEVYENHALLLAHDSIEGIIPAASQSASQSASLPASLSTETNLIKLDGGLLQPGYVDMQVNGGGGTMLNDEPTVEGIKTICRAHMAFGTTALLVTLITDEESVIERAIHAAAMAHEQQVPGFLGLHLEGPHLSPAKRGAHDPALMHPMSDAELNRLITAKRALPVLMVTVAPDVVTPAQITALSEAGIVVSLGHSNCPYQDAAAAIDAGASAITHLYNAMSPLNHRDPGLVGAALYHTKSYISLIADGHHVDDVALSIALATRRQHDTACLITDAMSSVGTDMTQLTLNDRTIYRRDGVLRLEDGTLAGADIDMHSAVTHIYRTTDLDWTDAVRLASCNPARCLKQTKTLGFLSPGYSANFIHVDANKALEGIWFKGRAIHP